MRTIMTAILACGVVAWMAYLSWPVTAELPAESDAAPKSIVVDYLPIFETVEPSA